MKTIGEAETDLRLTTASPRAASPLAARARSWLARPDVRAALTATLLLRFATSAFAAVIVLTLHPVYVHAVETMNQQGGAIGVFMLPAPLTGPASFLTGPWMRWDANFYLDIAREGYAHAGSTAFLPLYPLLIGVAGFLLGGHLVVAALLISTFATFAAFLCLYRLVERLTASASVARYSLAVACLLPIAFFLMAPYTESLFLALSLATILAALDKHWGRATLCVLLASLTRQQGILLAVLALPEIAGELRTMGHGGARMAGIRALWSRVWKPLVFACAPIAAYGVWLCAVVVLLRAPTPAQLLTSAHGWNQHFTVPGVGVLVDLIDLFAKPGTVLLHHLDIPLDACAAILAAWGLLAVRKRLPASLLIYLLLCWCVALTKVSAIWTTNSAARYLLAALPLCVVPALWLARARPALRIPVLAVAGAIWCIYLLDWVLWAWVS